MNTRLTITLVVFAMATLAGLIGVFATTPDEPESASQSSTAEVVVGDQTFAVEIARTTRERVQGLSGRAMLAEHEGLFFIFDDVDHHGIWMKDMNFALDIIWADQAFEIVHIERNVHPDTYPHVFYPQKGAKYVLETPAKTIVDNVKIGDKIIFYPQR